MNFLKLFRTFNIKFDMGILNKPQTNYFIRSLSNQKYDSPRRLFAVKGGWFLRQRSPRFPQMTGGRSCHCGHCALVYQGEWQ